MAPSGTPRPWAPPSASAPRIWYHRLRDKYAPFGLAAFRPGQVVPGRAAAALVADLLLAQGRPAGVDEPGPHRRRTHPRRRQGDKAHTFLAGVAARLDVDQRRVFPAYEDAFYYLWRERRLPGNVDPFDARLDDPLERDRIRRVRTRPRRHRWRRCPRWRRRYVPAGALPTCQMRRQAHGRGQATLGRIRNWSGAHDLAPPTPAHRQPAGIGPCRASRRGPAPDATRVRQRASPSQNGFMQCAPGSNPPTGYTRTALCVEARDPRRANGPKAERSAQGIRRAVRLHAAADSAGGLPGPDRRRRGHRRRTGPAGGAGRLPAAARRAPGLAADHARPRA
jgi:hypothetical protein